MNFQNLQTIATKMTRPLLIMSLALGLAPFFPEPHLVGKMRWVAGGGVGMQPMDYFDLLFHGFPVLLLLVSLGIQLAGKLQAKQKV